MSTEILFSVSETFSSSQEPNADEVTWTDIAWTGSTTATVAGTDSVLLMTATIPIENGSGDWAMMHRFVIDDVAYGPQMSSAVDQVNEQNGVEMAFAVTGISAGSHTFEVQILDLAVNTANPGTSTTRQSAFQVIEFQENASIVVDVYDTAADTPTTTYSDIAFANARSSKTQTFTPTANSLHLFIFNGTAEYNALGSQYADVQFEIGTTREGPASMFGVDGSKNFYSLCMMWARTGLAASSTDVAVRWQGVGGSSAVPDLGSAYERTFQVVEITADFDLPVGSNIEISSADSADATYTTMTGMTATPTIDSTDSVVLALAHYSQSPTSDTTADSQLTMGGAAVGGEARQFTDQTNGNVGSQLFWAETGVSGSRTYTLDWKNAQSTADTDTNRERTFQVIDFKTASAATIIPQASHHYRHNSGSGL